MKKFRILLVTCLVLSFTVIGIPAQAQTTPPTDNHTAREEAEGKEIWEKLQAKQFECKNLTNDNFESFGEYFMGQSIGDTQRHAAMNQMMISMMGEEGEKQVHIAMGKKNSGCDTSFIPMMGSGFGNMMGGWGGFSVFGWLSMILFWLLVVFGVVALVRYLAKSGSSKEDKTPLDILRERYARGEINKKEFEEKKKDLSEVEYE